MSAALAASTSAGSSRAASTVPTTGTQPTSTAPTSTTPPSGPPFAVGQTVIRFVDRSRTIKYPHHAREPRPLPTIVLYPAAGPASGTDLLNAPAVRRPFPLIVFAHGFAVTPAPYAPLLQAWARAGYVVAAPIFPFENAHAPGGPNENDLVNEPRDISFLITQLRVLGAAPYGLLSSVIDPRDVAVAGHSDGAETALAVAYGARFLDRRVRAAVVLSGAEMSGDGGFGFPAPSPPLLASQGTADPINPPKFTYQYFGLVPPPRYLLKLLGASHLPPYTSQEPQLRIVERVTTAFLDRYLKGERAASARITAEGNVAGISTVVADP